MEEIHVPGEILNALNNDHVFGNVFWRLVRDVRIDKCLFGPLGIELFGTHIKAVESVRRRHVSPERRGRMNCDMCSGELDLEIERECDEYGARYEWTWSWAVLKYWLVDAEEPDGYQEPCIMRLCRDCAHGMRDSLKAIMEQTNA